MIAFARVPIGDGGVLGCTSCSGSTSPGAHETGAVIGHITSAAEAWNSGPGPNVLFDGFEPFNHPALPALIAAAAGAGCERIGLATDAGALGVGGNAAGALGAGVRFIDVPLLGSDAALHDRLTGRPGLFDAARAGVSAFQAAASDAGQRVATVVTVRLCRHNRDRLGAIVATACSWSPQAIRLACGAGTTPDASALSDAVTIATAARVCLFGAGVPNHAPVEVFEVGL